MITDLDTEGALRAFTSIAAELRRREVVLAERGVPDIARLASGVLARLVVVVDECAVVLERAPELHRTFADIAARGRSLGVHLVLCTQRPVGVVRAVMLAIMGGLTGGLLFVLAVLWPAWDPRKQALHDKVVSATVVAGHPRARFGRQIFLP